MSELNEAKLSTVVAVRNVLAEPPVPEGNPYRYHVGIELELENVRIPAEARFNHWQVVEDGSLRNGREFVTLQPIRGATVAAAMNEFFGANVRWKNSPRTSTHVHVNVTDMDIGSIRAMFALSYAMEDSLFRVMDDSRKYCGYCMPLSEMNPVRVNNFLSTSNRWKFAESMGGANTEKYYGFNINSIRKHGTAEFRYFPGGPSAEELKHWVLYCVAIRHVAETIGLAGLRALETDTDLRALVEGHLGVMGQRMLELVGVEGMWASLQEVLSMIPETEPVARAYPLVFLSDALAEFVGRHYLKAGHKVEHFHKTVMPLKVVSRDDWFGLLDTCAKKRVAKPKVEEVDDRHEYVTFSEYDFPDNEQYQWQAQFGPIHATDKTYFRWIDTVRGDAQFNDAWEIPHRTQLKRMYVQYLEARKADRNFARERERGIEPPIPADYQGAPATGPRTYRTFAQDFPPTPARPRRR